MKRLPIASTNRRLQSQNLILAFFPAILWLSVCGPARADDSGFRFAERIHSDQVETVFVLRPGPAASVAAAEASTDSGDASREQPASDIREIEIQYWNGEVQTLEGFTASPIIDGQDLDGFVIEDLNFDGYKDLRLIEFLPAGPNIPYLVWLYDPDTKRFAASDIFADITSPEVDAEKRQIITRWRDGAAKNGTSYYEFRRDRLVLVREESREYADASRFRLIVRELRDAEMVEIENEMKTVDPAED
ncbi:MAG: hypothetical protein NXI24_03935 [bacterium]|nr:hypothetical protein [bacterium]